MDNNISISEIHFSKDEDPGKMFDFAYPFIEHSPDYKIFVVSGNIRSFIYKKSDRGEWINHFRISRNNQKRIGG